MKISDVKISDIGIMDYPFIRLSIAVKKDAVHQGGINLFGEKFGDYNQAIVMRLDYVEK